MKLIDLRSDTVTQPSTKMRKVMAEAEVGDDVYREDPTVNRLEKIAAEKLNKESAIFVSSGTQSNLLALLSHCQRGDEYIVGQQAHTYKYECGGAAVFGSIQPQPLPLNSDGSLDLDMAAAYVKPNDIHFANTKLLCLENTYWGNAIPMDYLPKAKRFTDVHHLAFHLDGARVFNAAVKYKVPVTDITNYFDTVSICLSKNLGAPVGSILLGSKSFIEQARKWRKMLGGGMRQAGVLAAAGIIALEENVSHLAEDHEKAIQLANGLKTIDEIEVDDMTRQTNMCFIRIAKEDAETLPAFMKENNILSYSGTHIRLALHLDVDPEDIGYVVKVIKQYYQEKK
ncbi:MAG: low-specificity L-threonine aldolase [Deltaproteobacteria bacterium]|jgi:threonine aldolase|nr:low-specificity L-threonine aldolase [Deltaproteobacteria bacterium]